MTKTIRYTSLALVASVFMAMTMPGCPGGAEMANLQQNMEMGNRRLQALEAQVRKMNDDNLKLAQAMVTLNQRYEQAAATINTLNSNVNALRQQLSRAPAPKAKKRR